MTVCHSGFFGKIAVGAIYQWVDHWPERHSMELSLGLFSIDDKDYGQINLAYRYAHWRVPFSEKVWLPMQVGLFLTRSLEDSYYFRSSPAQYPSAHYYDQTALRGGLEFGSSVLFEKTHLSLSYHLRLLDSGLVAVYNNANRDLQYYVSSGFSVGFHF